ncbi:hypothetical protein MAR_003824 [Mya arenaria]|uniref:Uncharacterized protein n=1 Tax=Mya arenaria TaxID=6604 RepID=A0ABY7EXN8_MYAAR|nr:hypothetical protein MAR_003824 [Mya arenaria]
MYKNSKAAVKGKIDLSRKTGGGGNDLPKPVRGSNGQPFRNIQCPAAKWGPRRVEQLLKMSMDIRNVIDYHLSEADIRKANAPLEDAVGDCDVPSTSGFVPSKGKMSRRKRKRDAGDQLFQLEEKRLTAETAAFSAQDYYWREKNRREEELHLVTLNLRKHQLKKFQ